MNNVLYPQSNVMQATGRALSVIMQGVNNKISLRKEWWVKALKELNEQSLRLMEIYMPESRPIIGGWYATDVFISSVLVRSVSDELNKFAQKTQSLTTTMHNIGIPNPSEEQKLMKEELADPVLAIEISRQPGMQMQQGATNQTPMITTEEDREEEMAMAAAGQASPVSAEGAIAQRNQRAGQPNRVAPTKK
jgi:hypothetical protein